VLLVQAAVAHAPHFPYGIIVYIDNKWVCDTAIFICQGTRPNPSIAQWKWWQKLITLLSSVPQGFLKAQWVPSHRSQKHVDEGLLTREQLILNSIADDLADKGAILNTPPPALLRAANTRIKVTMAIQRVIIAASLSRKQKDEELVAKLIRDAPIPLPQPPPALPVQLLPVRSSYPNFCWVAGGGLNPMQGLSARISVLANLTSTRSSKNAHEAFKWYITRLKWPAFPSPSNRGVSFLEMAFDFVSSTGVSLIGASHTRETPMEDVAAAISQLFVFFSATSAHPLVPHDKARVTSLAPLGLRNALWGFPVAPALLAVDTWTPHVVKIVGRAADPSVAVLRSQVGAVPILRPSPFQPLALAFARSLRS
jgi:hypothetical protein